MYATPELVQVGIATQLVRQTLTEGVIEGGVDKGSGPNAHYEFEPHLGLDD